MRVGSTPVYIKDSPAQLSSEGIETEESHIVESNQDTSSTPIPPTPCKNKGLEKLSSLVETEMSSMVRDNQNRPQKKPAPIPFVLPDGKSKAGKLPNPPVSHRNVNIIESSVMHPKTSPAQSKLQSSRPVSGEADSRNITSANSEAVAQNLRPRAPSNGTKIVENDTILTMIRYRKLF